MDHEYLIAGKMEKFDGVLTGNAIESLKCDDLDDVLKLQKSQRFKDVMQKVEAALLKGSEVPEHEIGLKDLEYLSEGIELEISIIHNFIRDKYRMKFPELESLVQDPIEYARAVKKIGNETDLTEIDLEGLLPSAIIMAVSVTASTTRGKPLPEEVLQKTVEACDRVLDLDSTRKKVLGFVESKLASIAPNRSAIVGSAAVANLER
ncbi:U4/U6 small nuclear ribonucleoprotein Prp31 homolog [Silene latifolia]|uniref:U4/U6 small nuclear ribonucleoprotein Prp31 homolog n=1 Tax=Silene latifolia TaxID=37657 RepID=UPI003D779FA1